MGLGGGGDDEPPIPDDQGVLELPSTPEREPKSRSGGGNEVFLLSGVWGADSIQCDQGIWYFLPLDALIT